MLGETSQSHVFASAETMPTSGYSATPPPGTDKGALGGDDHLGQIIPDAPKGADDEDNIKDEDFDTSNNLHPDVKLPFTESQARLKANMEAKFKAGEMHAMVDSISPEGGLVTGNTRVLVRGGVMTETGLVASFKNMELLFPHPKCKFGRNSQIVSAEYVGCTESPLYVHELEGKHKNRGSNPHCLILILFL